MTGFLRHDSAPVVFWLRHEEEMAYFRQFYKELELSGNNEEIVIVDDPKGPLDLLSNALKILCFETIQIKLAIPSTKSLVLLCDEWDEILTHLDRDFLDVYKMDPRKFEELVAELLVRENFKVELTKAKSDGGRDVLAYSDSSLGKHLHLFECKRYAPHRRVGVPLVRTLYGVLNDENATSAALVTTSEFTRDAREFEMRNSHRLVLHDHRYLADWIKRVSTK